MYVLANASLGMSPEKLAVQVAHALADVVHHVLSAGSRAERDAYAAWRKHCGQAKILLNGVDAESMRALRAAHAQLRWFEVHDAGRTELAAGAFTVLATLPLSLSETPAEIRACKTLRVTRCHQCSKQ